MVPRAKKRLRGRGRPCVLNIQNKRGKSNYGSDIENIDLQEIIGFFLRWAVSVDFGYRIAKSRRIWKTRLTHKKILSLSNDTCLRRFMSQTESISSSSFAAHLSIWLSLLFFSSYFLVRQTLPFFEHWDLSPFIHQAHCYSLMNSWKFVGFHLFPKMETG
jgi:hypothetical protein